MAISSIHIEAGGGGYFAHNSRETPTVNSIFSDEPNFCSCSKEEAFEVYRSELQIRSDAYTERTGQKLQKNAITHLSAIVNFNADHTPEDMQRVCDLLEAKLDTKVIQFAMHRDEGKVNEDGTPDKNYHAHIEFMGLDSKGESVRRKLDRPTLKALQTEVAKTLGMERGRDYAKERSPRPKRLDTYEWKAHKESQSKAVKEAVLATEKDLKAEIARLREQLKEQGATRSDYAGLEQINRELKEQIKAKDLTISDLKTALEASKATKEVSTPQTVEIDAPDKEQINKIGDRMQRVAKFNADDLIEASSIERKGVLGTKKEIDVPTLKENITMVLDQHNELHRETWGVIKKFNEMKEKILDGAKNVVESSKTALKTIFSLGEGKSLSEEKKSVETPEEAKERIQKFLAEQKAKKQQRGMSR